MESSQLIMCKQMRIFEDPLTKGLARDLVLRTSRGMGLKPISTITSKEAST